MCKDEPSILIKDEEFLDQFNNCPSPQWNELDRRFFAQRSLSECVYEWVCSAVRQSVLFISETTHLISIKCGIGCLCQQHLGLKLISIHITSCYILLSSNILIRTLFLNMFILRDCVLIYMLEVMTRTYL